MTNTFPTVCIRVRSASLADTISWDSVLGAIWKAVAVGEVRAIETVETGVVEKDDVLEAEVVDEIGEGVEHDVEILVEEDGELRGVVRVDDETGEAVETGFYLEWSGVGGVELDDGVSLGVGFLEESCFHF